MALLSVVWSSVPNYWAEGSAEVEGQKASIAVQTSIPYKQRLKQFGVKWDLTSDNLLHQAEVGNCTVQIP
jgi:hypothetical protein